MTSSEGTGRLGTLHALWVVMFAAGLLGAIQVGGREPARGLGLSGTPAVDVGDPHSGRRAPRLQRAGPG